MYLPSALAGDPLWEARITRHKEVRDSRLHTLERVPSSLLPGLCEHEALKEHLFASLTMEGSILLDSLGLFVGACLSEEDPQWSGTCLRFLEILSARPQLLVVVSEEVGMGLVADSPSGRLFCDRLGELRQELSRLAREVILIVSGLPLWLKRPG